MSEVVTIGGNCRQDWWTQEKRSNKPPRETFEETGVAVSITTLLCVAVMEVASAEYRGVNLYYRAEALSDITPHTSAKKERISVAAYQDLAALHPSQIHPVDRRILRMWRQKPEREAFYVHIDL